MKTFEKFSGLPRRDQGFVHLVMRPDGDEIAIFVKDAPLPNPEPAHVVGDDGIHKQVGGIIRVYHDRVGEPAPNFMDQRRLRRPHDGEAAVAVADRHVGKLFALPSGSKGRFLVQTLLRPDALQSRFRHDYAILCSMVTI
nr:hypothetical protein [uncultured Bilophila sp.]